MNIDQEVIDKFTSGISGEMKQEMDARLKGIIDSTNKNARASLDIALLGIEELKRGCYLLITEQAKNSLLNRTEDRQAIRNQLDKLDRIDELKEEVTKWL